MRTPPAQPGKPKALSKAEQGALERASPRSGARDAAIIAVLLYTGVRVEECARLDLDDIAITAKAGRLTIRGITHQRRTCVSIEHPLPGIPKRLIYRIFERNADAYGV